jgi:hypothetical protein
MFKGVARQTENTPEVLSWCTSMAVVCSGSTSRVDDAEERRRVTCLVLRRATRGSVVARTCCAVWDQQDEAPKFCPTDAT